MPVWSWVIQRNNPEPARPRALPAALPAALLVGGVLGGFVFWLLGGGRVFPYR